MAKGRTKAMQKSSIHNAAKISQDFRETEELNGVTEP
jgi:hypothetical protein